MKKIFTLMLIIFSPLTLACRPGADFKAPTFEERFQYAEYVFRGKIINIKAAGVNYELEYLVTKVFKGKLDNKITIKTTSSTCDPFGEMALLNDECIILATKEKHTLSGVFNGNASVCVNEKLIKQNKILNEREDLIRKLIKP